MYVNTKPLLLFMSHKVAYLLDIKEISLFYVLLLYAKDSYCPATNLVYNGNVEYIYKNKEGESLLKSFEGP